MLRWVGFSCRASLLALPHFLVVVMDGPENDPLDSEEDEILLHEIASHDGTQVVEFFFAHPFFTHSN
jgi:hypothetical protein